jgi:hypothetical protein
MYTYTIKLNDYPIHQCKGKHKAFEWIQAELKRTNTLGVWFGLKCETDTDIYTIERTIK